MFTTLRKVIVCIGYGIKQNINIHKIQELMCYDYFSFNQRC